MAIALGHEHLTATRPAVPDAPQASIFYIQAVQSLRQAIADLEIEKPPNMMFTIVFHCLLLVILQCFRKSFDELNIHLQHGLRMAAEAVEDCNATTTVPLKESFRLLKQYSTAVALFNPLSPQDAISDGVATATSNQALSNPAGLKATPSLSALMTNDQLLEDEEQDLLLDLIGITITKRQPRMDGPRDGHLRFLEPIEPDASLHATVGELRAKHAKLEQAIHRRTRSDNPARAQRFELADARCMLLGIYLRCRWSGYACNYDLEHDVFRRIVDKIQNSLDVEASRGRGGPPEDSGVAFSIGLGTIAPLFYVAIMCRKADIRSRAVELLSRCPRQDGPWSAKLARDLCRTLIAYEEQKAREGGCGYDLTGYIPEHCRVVYYYYYTSSHATDGTRRERVRVFRRASGVMSDYTHEDLDLDSSCPSSVET